MTKKYKTNFKEKLSAFWENYKETVIYYISIGLIIFAWFYVISRFIVSGGHKEDERKCVDFGPLEELHCKTKK
ncbi:MAG: hypothetical protein N3A54_02460 [Patescibacteria group bacterium]|nr:hypothetical protein [Patescibacteria group bacterium]